MAGVGSFASGLESRFAGKLPSVLVLPFAYMLPFAEITLGALLIFGLFCSEALVLAGLLMVLLTFGTLMEPSPETVAHNVLFALVIFVLLLFTEYNRFSLDDFRKRGGETM